MASLASLVHISRYYLSFFNADFLRISLGNRQPSKKSNREHIEAAVEWICRAQDARSEDDGVARSYSLIYNAYFQQKGWIASYPETTGYIIPTLFDWARITGNRSFFERAVRMADWECTIQLSNGAVQGGTVEQQPSPAIFNTGQVIFGWLRTFRETENAKYLDAASRAAMFLLEEQAEDGSWRRNLSAYAGDSVMEFYTYNSRTAWSLLALAGVEDAEGRIREAGRRNIDFTLGQQLENGWFKSNCLNKPEEPLVHTIAYCIRGVLEAGILLGNQDYIERASRAADALVTAQRADGSLAGRYDKNWQPTVEWSCLTGNAQVAIIWGKLYILTGDDRYLQAMVKINAFLKSVQLLNTSDADLHGGICGSYPIQGMYGKFEILNWAVKFFIDALLMEDAARKVLAESVYRGPDS